MLSPVTDWSTIGVPEMFSNPSVANVSFKFVPVFAVEPLYGTSVFQVIVEGLSDICCVEIRSSVVASKSWTVIVPDEFAPVAGVVHWPVSLPPVGSTPVAPATKHVLEGLFCEPLGIA